MDGKRVSSKMEQFMKTGTWECTDCHTKNPVLNENCSNCNNSKVGIWLCNCGAQFKTGEGHIMCPTCGCEFCMACGEIICKPDRPKGGKICKVKEHKEFLANYYKKKEG